ncbi:MAG: ATP-dependent helicase HrpB [Verrucomicrobia bacterium]|nr:ATP-dependent helicase HrpB [Verrucomicrobiota bacterium]
MRDLPIFEIEQRLLAAAAKQRRLVISAPTGSGKSTQVPQMLFRDDSQIVILQPRRLPTRMLAAWVAKDRGVKLGEEVGYQIRFDDVTSPRTRIRYVTEGVLLRQMLSDPTLRGIGTLIFDEFHERHLYGDITLARALQIQETARPDLLIIVMSATLDVAAVEKYLAPCTVLSSEGRTFPVGIEYLEKPLGPGRRDGGHYTEISPWEAAADALEQLTRRHEGDALVFMPGAYEISRTVQAVQDRLGSAFIVLPLHGDLAVNDQDAAVARYDRRKIVVATNVAETSLTIDGVQIVVDSGLARIPRYDPHRGINTLLVEKISRASADQRAGRAGRTAPGHCLRLWTEREHEMRAAQELPEVKRLDLAEVVLTLKASGVEDVKAFRWLEAPELKALERAEMLLEDLGATDHQSRITSLGRRMLAFPLHPRFSRMLLAAADFGCVRQAALIAALTQGRDLLVRGQGKSVTEARDELFGGETESDLFVMMRAYRYAERNGFNVERCRRLGVHAQSARQVGPLFEQFLQIAKREGLEIAEKPASREAVHKCVLTGFADHLARRLDAGTLRCALVHGRKGVLARESVVQAPLLVATEIAEVEGRDVNVLLSGATAVKEEWLRELFPEDFSETESVVYDAAMRRVFVERHKKFRDLVLEAERSEIVGQASRLSAEGKRSSETLDPLGEAARILAGEVLAGRLVLNEWGEAVEQWIVRVNCLRQWMPELELPAITAEDRAALVEQVCHGAVSYKEIKDKPVWPVVKAWLSGQQQAWVDEYAPERLELPGGRRAKITYAGDGPPRLAARIQDLYGVKGLWVAQRRVPLLIEILAPNQRPVQVTQNLANFWKETYPKLKQELQRKYPKHEWR